MPQFGKLNNYNNGNNASHDLFRLIPGSNHDMDWDFWVLNMMLGQHQMEIFENNLLNIPIYFRDISSPISKNENAKYLFEYG